MTSSREPPTQAEFEEQPAAAPAPEQPARPPRPRRQRSEPNPALDPRLVQLERRARPSRAVDVSLMVIGIAAFVFGVAMHFWVATSVLDGGDPAESSNVPEVTATPSTTPASVSPTPQAQATPTAQPDRTSCDEIRGTQYRSVTEREFFLANCTGSQPAPTPAAAQPTTPPQ